MKENTEFKPQTRFPQLVLGRPARLATLSAMVCCLAVAVTSMSCGDESTTQLAECQKRVAGLEETVKDLTSERDDLASKNQDLLVQTESCSEQLRKCKETDRGYWGHAAELINAERFFEASAKLELLIGKFPGSDLVPKAEEKKKELVKLEKESIKKTLSQLKDNDDIEAAIDTLNNYLGSEHFEDSTKLATDALEKYKKKYEKTKAEREIEQEFGLKVKVISTGWKWLQCDYPFVGPFLKLKVTNTSDRVVSNASFKAVFTKGSEVLGDDDKEIGGFGGTPLQRGQFTTFEIHPCWGSESDIILLAMPSVKADVTVNGKQYRTVRIAKRAVGVPGL